MPVYKDEKRNTWYFRVYVEDKFGNQKQKCKSGFRTKGEAKEAESKFLAEYNHDYTDITFQELYDIFIKSKKQSLKPQSIRSIISRYSTHILPYFKEYKVRMIDNKAYLGWKEWVLEKGFTYKYNSNLHGSMVAILNYAMDFYGLEKNIASKVGNFARKDYIEKVDFWRYEEFKQFIKYVDDDLYSALFKTLYYTGMRLGECLALNWNDIKDNYIDVSKTLARGKNDNHYTITTPKTRKSVRHIKLDNETIDVLIQLKTFYKSFVGFSEDWFVFGGLCPLSQTTIGRKKDEYCEKANAKRIKIHDLRHSHATLLLSRGVPITVISKRLGHADMTMTLNTYSHLIPEDEDKAIDLINNLNKNYNNLTKQENFERIEKVGTKKSL
jgi:integrase